MSEGTKLVKCPICGNKYDPCPSRIGRDGSVRQHRGSPKKVCSRACQIDSAKMRWDGRAPMVRNVEDWSDEEC